MQRIFIVLVLMRIVYCDSPYPPHIFTKSSSVLDDNNAHKKSDTFSEHSEKGVANSQEEGGFNKEHASKKVLGHDSGNYNHENAQKNQQENSGHQEGEKFHQQNFDSMNKVGRKGGHKKGHHKSGYHNSYHKDESENKSTYYDDSDDEGGHFAYNAQNGAGAQQGGDRFRQSYDNNRLNNNYDQKKGHYDVNGNYGNQRDDRISYGNRNYYNDRRDKSNANFDNARGEAGRNVEESYVKGHPHYIEPYYRRYEPRRTITVYEDPRAYQGGYPAYQRPYERRYDSDRVHLDFRQPIPYRQPYYGYYK